MIQAYKSDTGQFVLLHHPSQTVIIDPNLEEAFNKMQAYIKEHHPEMAQRVMEPFEEAKERQRDRGGMVRSGLLLVLVLLPFLWLGILHYTIASIVSDFLARDRKPSGPIAQEQKQLRQDVDKLQQDVSALGQSLTTAKSAAPPAEDLRAINQQVEALKQQVAGAVPDIASVKEKTAPMLEKQGILINQIDEMKQLVSKLNGDVTALADKVSKMTPAPPAPKTAP